jgi:hypothetical protein
MLVGRKRPARDQNSLIFIQCSQFAQKRIQLIQGNLLVINGKTIGKPQYVSTSGAFGAALSLPEAWPRNIQIRRHIHRFIVTMKKSELKNDVNHGRHRDFRISACAFYVAAP